jgi:hypothetical protein
LSLALSCLLPGGCGDDPAAANVRKQTGEAWETLKDYGAGRREEFIVELDGMVKAIDVQLDNLRARSAREGEAGRAQIEALLSELVRQRGDITRRLSELKDTSKEAWAAARDSTLDAFRTLRDGVDAAVRDG